MDPINTPQSPPEAAPPIEDKVIGYCRTCGRALTEATKRAALGTLYCEEHVPSVNVPPPVEPPSPYAAGPQAASSGAAPGLAFVLGFIPGVGAIYNGQYAKGFVHVLIFGLLVHAVDSRTINGGFEALFGLMLAAFVFYQAFEAYHTAKARAAGITVDEFSSVLPVGGKTGIPFAPVMLILLGILFLLENFGLLDLERVLRYWPILIILLGVYLLANRLRGEVSHE